MLLDIAIIVIGLAVLAWSADLFIDGAAGIATRMGLSPLIIGMTIVSVGTSAPEILVSLMSASTGSGSLAVGNAFGSNIANVGLVLGVTVLITPIAVGRTTAFTDIPILLFIVALCWLLLADNRLSSSDAVVLTVALLLYLIRMTRHQSAPDNSDLTEQMGATSITKASGYFFVGLILLLISSRALVLGAVNIATALEVPELVIGLTVVALGTSLPELAASLTSALKKQADIAIGAVVGSNMFNLLIVLAIPGFFESVELSRQDLYRDLGTVSVSTLLMGLFVWLSWNRETSTGYLKRVAGGSFLMIYMLYYLWLYVRTGSA
jgi:cation:H+ antiporter